MRSTGKQRVCVAPLSCMPGTFHGGVRGGVAKALPVNLEYVTVSKRVGRTFWAVGGEGGGLDV